MEKERFLVTGCAGFIGGHMLDRLVGAGYEVVGVDDLSTGNRDNMKESWGRFRFIEGSVCDGLVVEEALRGVSRVIHLASVPSVPRSVGNPVESAVASIVGTVTLLDGARRAGVKRVVQSTSSSAYGDSEVLPRVETLAVSPMSPYAVAKMTQEYYGVVFGKCYGLDVISLRYFNIFGPRQNPLSQYAAVIPKFIRMMMGGERPEVFGDGEQTRDFTYVENAVEANMGAALASGYFGGEVCNVGAGSGHSLNELVGLLNGILGTDLAAEYKPARVGDVRDSLADVGKAERLFGYGVRVDFADGVRRTARYFGAGEGSGGE